MSRAIGMFDSGVGGISVLRDAVRMLPHERFIFYGDNQNAPYGVKTQCEILNCTQRAIQTLLERNVKALVLACNTATAAAAKELRAKLDIPVIGMEPALKPGAFFAPWWADSRAGHTCDTPYGEVSPSDGAVWRRCGTGGRLRAGGMHRVRPCSAGRSAAPFRAA